MTLLRSILFSALVLPLVACDSPPNDAVEELPPLEPTSGLVERRPDTCTAEQYGHWVGQHSSVVQAEFPTDRPVRIEAPTGIYTEEYDPRRIKVKTNLEGVVVQLTCG